MIKIRKFSYNKKPPRITRDGFQKKTKNYLLLFDYFKDFNFSVYHHTNDVGSGCIS